MKPTYLDYNATTPVDQRVLTVMWPYLNEIFGSSSSQDHRFGWAAAEAVEDSREQVAKLINARPKEILFTSGATESINFALKGHAQQHGLLMRCVVTCMTEHAAVLDTCRQMVDLYDTHVDVLAVDRSEHIDMSILELQLARPACAMVAMMLANNETGTIHPIRDIAKIVHKAGGSVFCDITQAVGKLPVDVKADGIDFAAFSAHKLYGPKGVGAFYVREGLLDNLEPLIVGGGQEFRHRGGTLNVPSIVGFGEACHIAVLEMQTEAERVRNLRDRLEATILEQIPEAWVNGDKTNRVGNTTNIGFRGVSASALIRDMHDIAVSTQAACSTGSNAPSHVLKALGLTDEEAFSCIRISLGRFTTDEEIDYALDKIITSVRKLRRRRRAFGG